MRVVALEERIPYPTWSAHAPQCAQADWPTASGPKSLGRAQQAERPCTCCASFSQAHLISYPRLQLIIGHMDETLPVMMTRCDQTMPRKKT